MDLNDWGSKEIKEIAKELAVNVKGAKNKGEIIDRIIHSNLTEEQILKVAEKFPITQTAAKKRAKNKNETGSIKQSSKYRNIPLQIESITQTIIEKIVPLLENYNQRISRIEKSLGITDSQMIGIEKINTKISDNLIYKEIVKFCKNSDHKIGEMTPIPEVIEKIHNSLNLDKKTIGDAMYRLFHSGSIDLQPGKARLGEPLQIDGSEFYWVKIMEEI